MLELQIRRPRRELQSFVRVYCQRDIDPTDAETIEPCPARLEQTLEFEFGETIWCLSADGGRRVLAPVTIVGAIAQPCAISLPGGARSFGVFFQPAGFSRLFRIPIAELSLDAYDARDILGHSLES